MAQTMNRDDNERVCKALILYAETLLASSEPDLKEYNRVEAEEAKALYLRLGGDNWTLKGGVSMAQTQKVSKNNTTTKQRGNLTVVTLHETDVVTFDTAHIVLRTGGWRTATTKTRMNQASNQFDLGFRVSQKDRQWSVEFRGETLPFTEGMLLKR